MLRRLIVLIALAAGMSMAATMTLARPALAKGPTQARITGPGLAHAIVLSGEGEPGQQGVLATLAGQTGLFLALFGPAAIVPAQAPARLRTPPPATSLGPRYLIVYTVPGVAPRPGEQFGRIRQDLYPRAAGGPVIYTPPGQRGFGGPLQVTGWRRAVPRLAATLVRLGVPRRLSTQAAPRTRPAAQPAAGHRVAGQPAGSPSLPWLIASAAAIAAAALAGAALWLRHRRPHRGWVRR